MKFSAAEFLELIKVTAFAFTPETLAKRWSVSPRTVRDLIRDGSLRAFRIGDKLLRISHSAVEQFEQCQNTDSPGSEENSPSHGTTADAAFVTRLALTVARTQTGA
jgi:excisionase family DNA binding protein